MNSRKDRIAETERVKERKRARVERGTGDLPMEPGNKDDELVAVRHADASGGYIIENEHEEDSIQVNKRESEATNGEQTDEWRKTVRFESICCFGTYLVRSETPSRLGSVLVQKSGHVEDDVHISALDVSEKCWSGIEEKMPEVSREGN